MKRKKIKKETMVLTTSMIDRIELWYSHTTHKIKREKKQNKKHPPHNSMLLLIKCKTVNGSCLLFRTKTLYTSRTTIFLLCKSFCSFEHTYGILRTGYDHHNLGKPNKVYHKVLSFLQNQLLNGLSILTQLNKGFYLLENSLIVLDFTPRGHSP